MGVMSDAKPEGIRPKDTGSGMTPSQRYLFDLTGFLHVRGAVRGAELEAAQAAIDRLIATPRHEREAAGFTHQADGNYPPEEPIVRYEHAYAFDRVLEKIAMHPAIWPAVKECTAGQPRLSSGSLQVQYSSEEPWRGTADNPGGFHCVKEHSEWRCRYEVGRDRQIVCYPIIVFFCALPYCRPPSPA